MPKFFMHIHDAGAVIEDLEGHTFATLELARAEAEAAIREMLAEKVMISEEIDGQSIEIVDETGRSLASVPFRDQLRLQP